MDEIKIVGDKVAVDFGFFVLDVGYEIKVYKNHFLKTHSAILSPELFDKLFNHFQKLNSEQNPERSVATEADSSNVAGKQTETI